jgi:uncharacterized protein YciI
MDIPKDMRNYFVAVIYAGPNVLERGTPAQTALQVRHLAFNRKCAEAGKYKAFGPLTDRSEILAFSVIDVPTLAEAQALIEQDPGGPGRALPRRNPPAVLALARRCEDRIPVATSSFPRGVGAMLARQTRGAADGCAGEVRRGRASRLHGCGVSPLRYAG